MSDAPHQSVVHPAVVRQFMEIIDERAKAAFNGADDPGLLQLVRVHPALDRDVTAAAFEIGNVDAMVEAALTDATTGHNVYIEARTVSGVTRGRGKAKDTRGVFALVVDSDQDKGKAGQIEAEPSLVVETSPGNCHAWFFLDRAVPPEDAKPLGDALRAAAGADSDTGVITQPYRVAGTPNYPNADKRARGRIIVPTQILKTNGPLWTPERLRQAFPVRRSEQYSPDTEFESTRGKISVEPLLAETAVPGMDRSARFHEAVHAAVASGMTLQEFIAMARLYPQGCASKYLFPSERLHEEAQRSWDKVRAEATRSARASTDTRRPMFSTAAELRRKEFPPIRYVVPGYIVEGCTLLAGRPKLGKSWLMLDAGLAVASGHFCLGGETSCEQGDVLYIALEDNERRLQRRIDRLLGPLAWDWPRRFQYATEWPRANEGGLDAIREWIRNADQPRLIVIDVLVNFKSGRGDKETLYEADYAALKGLQSIAGEFNIAIVAVHHVRKSAGEYDPFEKVSGTLGLSAAADSTLILDRDGNGATLYGRGRDVEEIEVAVTFDADTCKWRALGKASEVRRTDERAAILAALADSTEPMSPTEIADATRMSNQNVRQLLASMVKAGEVRKLRRGRYQHPDHQPPPDHKDHKITNLDDYRRARDGDDE